MPVRRFRSIEEMKRPRWYEPGSPEHIAAMRAVWELALATGVHRFPPGVYRHRTIEELNRQTEEWAQANFREHLRRIGLDTDGRPGGS